MSDFDSSLPIRTENDGDVIIRIGDGTVPSQYMTVNPDGSLNVTLSADKDYGAVGASTLRTAAQIGNATGAADFNAGATGAQTLRVAANQGAPNTIANAWPAKITDGTNTASVNADGSLNVAILDAVSGTPVNDYNTSSSLAGAGTSNHDYTVTAGKTLHLNQVDAAGSGKMKIEVEVETGVSTGSFDTKFVQFNSTATPNMSVRLTNPISVAAGVRVRIHRTNMDKSAQDIYSTVCGYEV